MDKHEQVVEKMIGLYHMLVCHNGFGEMSVDVRILKRGQKEVILRCGKQYRFVVDNPAVGGCECAWLRGWKHDEDNDNDDHQESMGAVPGLEPDNPTPADGADGADTEIETAPNKGGKENELGNN